MRWLSYIHRGPMAVALLWLAAAVAFFAWVHSTRPDVPGDPLMMAPHFVATTAPVSLALSVELPRVSVCTHRINQTTGLLKHTCPSTAPIYDETRTGCEVLCNLTCLALSDARRLSLFCSMVPVTYELINADLLNASLAIPELDGVVANITLRSMHNPLYNTSLTTRVTKIGNTTCDFPLFDYVDRTLITLLGEGGALDFILDPEPTSNEVVTSLFAFATY